MAEIEGDVGQVETTTPDTSIDAATVSSPDATAEIEQTSAENGTTFFDPNAIPEELQPAYKNMQAEFTRKMQGIADQRQKAEVYDQFMSDPRGSLMRMAQQYGLTLQEAAQMQQAQQQPEADWQPQTWDEVMAKAEERAEARVMQRLQPLLETQVGELQQMKRSDTERKLDESWPEWRNYESEMMDILKKHPSLRDDPVTLAELATPQSVKESRMYKKALESLQAKQKASTVSGAGNAGVQSATTPSQATSFHEAYLAAKRAMG
jgi:hypothetical protein